MNLLWNKDKLAKTKGGQRRKEDFIWLKHLTKNLHKINKQIETKSVTIKRLYEDEGLARLRFDTQKKISIFTEQDL